MPTPFPAEDPHGTAGEVELPGEESNERVVGGPAKRRRHQPHEHRLVSHAADFGLLGAGDDANIDFDARGGVSDQEESLREAQGRR